MVAVDRWSPLTGGRLDRFHCTYACPKPVKETCYNAFVRPTVEYSSCVWDPHQQNNIQQLEKIQKRAARYVTGNHALIEGNTAINMTTLGWVPLEERRARSKRLLLFKSSKLARETLTSQLMTLFCPPVPTGIPSTLTT